VALAPRRFRCAKPSHGAGKMALEWLKKLNGYEDVLQREQEIARVTGIQAVEPMPVPRCLAPCLLW